MNIFTYSLLRANGEAEHHINKPLTAFELSKICHAKGYKAVQISDTDGEHDICVRIHDDCSISINCEQSEVTQLHIFVIEFAQRLCSLIHGNLAKVAVDYLIEE